MRRFFHTSAATVGMTKNGAMTKSRAAPWPKKSWSNSTAKSVPNMMVAISTPPTSNTVLMIDVMKLSSVSR